VRTFVVNGTGEKIEADVLALPIDGTGNRNPVQAMGSTITYARRYALMSFFALVGEDDDGEGASMAKASAKQQASALLLVKRKSTDYFIRAPVVRGKDRFLDLLVTRRFPPPLPPPLAIGVMWSTSLPSPLLTLPAFSISRRAALRLARLAI
jgi:hypothetical protein